MNQPLTAILIGAGQRGADSYAPYALRHPEQLRFVAVAEPIAERRSRFATQHNVAKENQYESWEPLLSQPKFAEAALICTQDQQHTAPALAALKAGYDVLLEKPMATTLEECVQLVHAAEQSGRQMHICHVMRYTPHAQKLREVIQSGVLGEVVNVSHRENVSYWHMAHSYVRGNWGNLGRSAPMILAKCCHDFDILLWWLGRCCEHLSSTGSLLHFRAENAPTGAPAYCLDGCPAAETCPYEARRIYLELEPLWQSFAETASGFNRLAVQAHQRYPKLVKTLSPVYQPLKTLSPVYQPLKALSNYRGWPLTVLSGDPTPENILEALHHGPYGRCVYHCDNDVVDRQAVLMQFEGNLPVTLTMQGHSHIEYRTTRIEGTRATLLAEFGHGGSWIEVRQHRPDRHIRYDTTTAAEQGHGGGDEALMAGFVRSLRGETNQALTLARQSLESHRMAFAAEQARLEGRVIKMDEVMA
jgi:predicted dehydrogenase